MPPDDSRMRCKLQQKPAIMRALTGVESGPAFRVSGWRTVILALIAVFAIDMSVAPAQTGNLGFVLYRISAADYLEPEDLALSASGMHLYVTDTKHNTIRVVQPYTLDTLAQISHRSLKEPKGIAMGDDRLLYVTDTGNNRVISYRINHDSAEPVRTYRKNLKEPTGVAKWRNHLYIVNPSEDSIIVHKPGGKLQKREESGGDPGEFDDPVDILVAPEGHIIVSDSDNDRIQVLSQGLEPIKILEDAPYDFDEPTHMALDELGNLFVADTGNHRIVVLDADFNIVGQIGTGRSGDKAGQMDGPRGVAVGSGRVWVADTGNNRILLYKYSLRR